MTTKFSSKEMIINFSIYNEPNKLKWKPALSLFPTISISFSVSAVSLTSWRSGEAHFLILLLLYEATESVRNIEDELNIITVKEFLCEGSVFPC